MTIAKKINAYIEKSSWIRKMFEEGARLKAQHGADKVFDFSLGNPNLPPPESFNATLQEVVVTCGPDVGIIEFSIDNSSFRQIDQFTQWSSRLHLPWAYILDAELGPGDHELTLRTTDRRNPNSLGNACRIVHFLAN